MNQLDRRTILALGGFAGLSLVGCSGADAEPTPTMTPKPTPTPTPSADTRPRWPLTGMLLKDTDQAHHAAVAVKVPDNEGEHPQVGINDADIVFVEVDGYPDASGYSGTRLMPVFHSTMAEAAAPVRSQRPTDAPLLAPITAVMGSTGGSGWVLNYIGEFSDSIVNEDTYVNMKGTGAYSIDYSRVRTIAGTKYYDRAVVCNPKKLGRVSKAFPTGPQVPYFPFATSVDTPSTTGGKKAKTVAVPWKGDDYFMTYTWDSGSGTYLRSMPWGEHVLADGSRVTTDNILIVQCRQYTDKLASGSGGAEPIHDVINTTGSFLYAAGGTYVTGSWTKGAVDEPFEFTLTDGSPLLMTPGRTFVELAADDATITIR